ncbi:hypothetical protein P3T26_007415 [Streptomyces sp. MAA16]|nr:hypothetical protein [Streptomyces sp. MAA16]
MSAGAARRRSRTAVRARATDPRSRSPAGRRRGGGGGDRLACASRWLVARIGEGDGWRADFYPPRRVPAPVTGSGRPRPAARVGRRGEGRGGRWGVFRAGRDGVLRGGGDRATTPGPAGSRCGSSAGGGRRARRGRGGRPSGAVRGPRRRHQRERRPPSPSGVTGRARPRGARGRRPRPRPGASVRLRGPPRPPRPAAGTRLILRCEHNRRRARGSWEPSGIAVRGCAARSGASARCLKIPPWLVQGLTAERRPCACRRCGRILPLSACQGHGVSGIRRAPHLAAPHGPEPHEGPRLPMWRNDK